MPVFELPPLPPSDCFAIGRYIESAVCSAYHARKSFERFERGPVGGKVPVDDRAFTLSQLNRTLKTLWLLWKNYPFLGELVDPIYRTVDKVGEARARAPGIVTDQNVRDAIHGSLSDMTLRLKALSEVLEKHTGCAPQPEEGGG